MIIRDGTSINNPLWLDRIADLSSGNPRLAIMAARSAIDNNGLNSINDVSSLYDLYFSSLLKDISKLENKNVVAVAGVLSFFRSVDKTNNELMERITEIFGIEKSEFWKTCIELHEFELVDIYENEVVKISDQIISTYLFYLCFFKKNQLSFASIIDGFILRQADKIRDALYPCLNAFNRSSITKQIKVPIKKKLDNSLNNDIQTTRALFETFPFVLQTDALRYIRDEISKITQEKTPLTSIEWEEANTNVAKNDLIGLIKLFFTANSKEFDLAIELSLDLARKQPSSIPDIIYMFVRNCGFKRHSHNWDYDRQVRLLDLLIAETKMGKDEICSRIFIAVSKYLIRTEFQETVEKGHSLQMFRFQLASNDTIKEYRRKIWETVFTLSTIETLKKPALRVLSTYAPSGYHVAFKELRSFDAHITLPLVKAKIDLSDFGNALIIEKFISKFSDLGLQEFELIKEKCKNRVTTLHKILNFDHSDIEQDQFERIKLSKIAEYSENFAVGDYLSLMDDYSKLLEFDGKTNQYRLQNGLALFFTALANRDEILFVEVVKALLANPGVFENQVIPHVLPRLFEYCSTEEVLKIIKGDNTSDRFRWHLAFHDTIPEDRCTINNIEKLYALIENEKCGYSIYRWDDFQKYAKLDQDFYLKLARVINTRCHIPGGSMVVF